MCGQNKTKKKKEKKNRKKNTIFYVSADKKKKTNNNIGQNNMNHLYILQRTVVLNPACSDHLATVRLFVLGLFGNRW